MREYLTGEGMFLLIVVKGEAPHVALVRLASVSLQAQSQQGDWVSHHALLKTLGLDEVVIRSLCCAGSSNNC